MGRTARRVPADWEHPKNPSGAYQPMYDESFEEAAEEWKRAQEAWGRGMKIDREGNEEPTEHHLEMEYWEWDGPPPNREYYRPNWPEESRTHLQMYEDCSEGTPISPVMKEPEELAHWLADNKASAFGGMTASYDQWLATIKAGWAPSMVADKNGLRSGVAACEKLDTPVK